jgi:HAD superfamily hydrolase (TIGR01549 family)
MGRSPITDEELRFCHMNTVHHSIHRLFPRDAEIEAQAVEFLRNKVDLKEFIQYLRMEPNVIETLSLLKGKGIQTAISTNRTTSMKHIMERFDLWRYFDMVVTALDVERPKPDKESVEKILAGLQVRSGESLYIGDSEIDQQTAESAAVRFVAYKNRTISTGLYIDDHLQLLGILES